MSRRIQQTSEKSQTNSVTERRILINEQSFKKTSAFHKRSQPENQSNKRRVSTRRRIKSFEKKEKP